VQFPLTGEPLALDLVNTRPLGQDLLATPADLAAWLTVQSGRLADVSGPAPSPADLAAVHAVRDHAAAALDHARHGHRPPAAALRGLEAALRAAPAHRRLGWDGTTVTAVAKRTGRLGARAAAELAESTVDLLADPKAVAAIRECAADDCVLVFLPARPRRVWCSAARCGNRTRVARHYARHHAHPQDHLSRQIN
jgi:predicted RNA-binding Zn ribbon-like protein